MMNLKGPERHEKSVFSYSPLIKMEILWYAVNMKILNFSRKRPAAIAIFLCVLVFTSYPHDDSQAASWTISAEEWARPRSGLSLVQMEPLMATIQALNMEYSTQLLIRYPGGEEGALWASELRDWLVSLGIPSGRIEIRPGQSSHENVTLMLKYLTEDKE